MLADVLEMPLVRLEESESAALGAAVQAAWTVRRMRGEKVGADQVGSELVRTVGEPIEPDASASGIYREMRARFRDAVRASYGA